MNKVQIDLIRKHFPALTGDWIFMDNAGGSQTLKTVVDRISEYLLTSDVQHGASYAISQLSMERVATATAEMASYINARYPEEIVMGGSTSLLIRILSLCISRQWKEGDEVIVSGSDHEANVSPWMDLQRQGIKVHVWYPNRDSLRFELEDLAKLMNDRTKLVALCHTSNILGTLNPIKEIARFVHDHNALICVDGVAHAPHRLIDVQDLDVDFYVFSFYKVYGPHYAMMYGRRQLLYDMPGINHYFIDGAQSPYKFQPGNVNFEFCYGMMGLVDYLDDLYHHHFPGANGQKRERYRAVFDLLADHEEEIAQPLIDFLLQHPKVQIIGEQTADKTLRVPTICFVHDEKKSDSIVELVDPHHIAIRYGDFYAKKLIDMLGLQNKEGVVRVSLVHYNSMEEVQKLVRVFEQIL